MDDTVLPPGIMLDPVLTKETLSNPPFYDIQGIFNFRDYGNGYPSSLQPNARVKPLVLFRSGEVSHITPKGKEQFKERRISKVFDLRADVEKSKYGTSEPDIDGVEFVRASIMDEAMDPVGIAMRLKEFSSNEGDAFFKMNTQILLTGGPALEKILVHLRDNVDSPCLLHCTAGKDRAGLLAAVIIMLLGVDDENIVKDYTLTTFGLQPVIPLFVKRFREEDVYRNNWQGALATSTAKPESMRAMLDWIRSEYGGAEGYVLKHTTLAESDIATIRQNLLSV